MKIIIALVKRLFKKKEPEKIPEKKPEKKGLNWKLPKWDKNLSSVYISFSQS